MRFGVEVVPDEGFQDHVQGAVVQQDGTQQSFFRFLVVWQDAFTNLGWHEALVRRTSAREIIPLARILKRSLRAKGKAPAGNELGSPSEHRRLVRGISGVNDYYAAGLERRVVSCRSMRIRLPPGWSSQVESKERGKVLLLNTAPQGPAHSRSLDFE